MNREIRRQAGIINIQFNSKIFGFQQTSWPRFHTTKRRKVMMYKNVWTVLAFWGKKRGGKCWTSWQTWQYVRKPSENTLLSTEWYMAEADSGLVHISVFTSRVFFHISGMNGCWGGEGVTGNTCTYTLMNIYALVDLHNTQTGVLLRQ